MKKITYLLFCLFIGIGLVSAQTTRITGTVISADDGEPVIGASVIVKGTTVGTVTDFDGNFELNVPTSTKTVTVSYVGMTSQEVPVQATMRIVLQSDALALEEVMVVAYGTAKKSSFTGSAATLKGDEIQKRKVSNVTKALDGLAPGVQVTSGSGQPGAGSDVYIRGLGSINASNKPLYVVDGIPYDGNISSISPEDIENMTVLKDASAGALYGSRGANGVVMITTKKGKKGVTEVTFKANFGVSNRGIPRYETMKSRQYIETVYDAFRQTEIADGTSPDKAGVAALDAMVNGAQAIFGNNEQYNPYNYKIADLIDPTTGLIRSDAQLLWEDDWLDEVTQKNAFRHEYMLNLNGGSENTQYMVSLGYLNEEGILKTTNFERYSGRAGIDSNPKEWFRTGLNANLVHAKTNSLGSTGSTTSNVWYSAQLMGPIFPIYLRDRENGGAFILDNDGNKQFDYGDFRPAGSQGNFNSVATLYDDKYKETLNGASARTYMAIGDTKEGWAKGLKLTANFGVDYYSSNQLRYYNPYFGNAESSNGRVRKTNGTLLSYTFNQLLTFDRKFNDHHIDALLGHEWYAYEYSSLLGEKTGFPFGGLYEPDAASTVYSASGYTDKYRIESFFGRLNYDYKDKYYISGSLRRDGSSRFQTDHRWGTFWSIGGNYRISEEEFMDQYDWLDNLSVRVSYGGQGNDMITDPNGYQDYYPWQSLYDLGYANASEPGALVNKVENARLSWESSNNLNIGLDVSVFKRLNVGLEWFNRKTFDLLLYYPLPMSSGFEGYNRNSGEMKNSGLEVTINGQIIKTNDFEWSATILASAIKNKVTKLTDGGQDIIYGNIITREGEPLRSHYLIRSAGVDPLTGEPLYWAHVDADGKEVDPYITTNSTYALASRYIAGDKYADLYGSISTSLRYKGFDFSISTNYSIGGEMVDQIYQGMMSFSYPAQVKHKNMERMWKKPGDITDIPAPLFGANRPYTDDALVSASYFSLKNITFGYALPSRLVKNWGLKNLRLSVTADNLLLLTHLKGMDPRYSITGSTDYVYAPTRTVSFGIDIKF